jgi:large subunit ribosomal protein L18
MSDKKQARLRRARRVRTKIAELGVDRLCINRTPRHIYAQVISADGSKVLTSASTLEKDLGFVVAGNIESAKGIGALIAERAKAVGILKVAFDRSGFKYHGRVKALADAARNGGLDF